MVLNSYLTDIVQQAFLEAWQDHGGCEVTLSSRPDLCQFQCNGALPLAKRLGKPPMEIAEKVLTAIQDHDAKRAERVFSSAEVARPGFLNLNLTDTFLSSVIEKLTADDRLGVALSANPERIILDFGGPNIAKPMHVGHLRSTVIGESLRRILDLRGHTVISDVHLGDWGTPMGMLIAAIQDQSPELPYFNASTESYPTHSPVTLEDLQRMYPLAAQRYKSDADFEERSRRATKLLQGGDPGCTALWRHLVKVSVDAASADFEALGAHFDLWRGESDAHPYWEKLLASLQAQGVVSESEGALVIPAVEGSEDPPLILVKSDGAVTYAATDLGTILHRKEELSPDRMIYVVDARQGLHFSQVFEGAERSGLFPKDRLEHVGFGTVNGKDGKPFKTREGGVKQLRSLLDDAAEASFKQMQGAGVASALPEEEQRLIARIVGIGAVKFADLSIQRTANYVFDLERFTSFDGKTGPYIQYAAVRMGSILEKARAKGIELFSDGTLASSGVTSAAKFLYTSENPAEVDAERALSIFLTQLPQAVFSAEHHRMPHHLCVYAYELSQIFSRFYQSCSVLNAPSIELVTARLALVQLSLRALTLITHLLGIEIPARM